MQELLKDEIENLGGSFDKLEEAAMSMMLSPGKVLLQRVVDSHRNGYQNSSIPCECGSSKKFIQHRPIDIHTLFGWIKLKRAYYHCQDCGAGLAPYDVTSSFGSGPLSPALAKACCVLAVDDSFEQTSRKIEQLFGQKVSDNTIERAVYQVGSIAYKQQQQQMEEFLCHRHISPSDFKPESHNNSADVTTVHEVDVCHEVKIGSIYWQDVLFVSGKRYVGFFENSEIFDCQLCLESFPLVFR
jgi:hypothetical protein